jgi:hypothetical protein
MAIPVSHAKELIWPPRSTSDGSHDAKPIFFSNASAPRGTCLLRGVHRGFVDDRPADGCCCRLVMEMSFVMRETEMEGRTKISRASMMLFSQSYIYPLQTARRHDADVKGAFPDIVTKASS